MAYALPLLPAPMPTPPRAVRLSLTDRCDLACVYCRPHKQDGYLTDRLDVDAWVAMVEGLVAAGVRRVRITGGEPLLHPRVVEVVERLARLPLEDLALTTNATRLKLLAPALRGAGLHRLNVSVDSLVPARFARLTRGGDLGRVLDGLETARQAGFREIKLNAVVLRGENDGELRDLVEFAWAHGMVPRFLEVMMIGEGAQLAHKVVSAAEMRASLAPLLCDETPRKEDARGPARYVAARHDPSLRVGFISGTTDTFCEGCDRLRVASDGVLRPCLAKSEGVAAGIAARRGDKAAVADAMQEAWASKPDGRVFRGCTESSARDVSIRAIGG